MTNGVVRTFDQVAPVYDSVLPFFETAARGFAGVVEPQAGARVLDLGCGTGAVTAELLARGCDVVAVDASPAMIERLRATYPTVDAHVMDAAALNLPDAAFDVVVATFVLHLLDDPAAAAREARRVLRPGGLFAFAMPGPHVDPSIRLDETIRLFAEYAKYLPPGGSMGAPFDEPAVLAAAGFTDVQERLYTFEVAVPDGNAFWQFTLTHGTKKFVDDLPAERRSQFEDEIRALPAFTMTRTVWVYSGLVPSI